ncbi:putative SLC26A/SulP transporter [Lupinus albus]|uniref:Putative SLC26A/SulP transporter n=1 Tax=Lupinus albus TaxID=3870 RepID=A0A6A4Q2G1_LUPAL|nr:putative SLC26A/SulP transporter [Lupinus albus]
MVGQTNGKVSSTLEKLMELKNTSHNIRAQWVLNPPEPPCLWRQVLDNIKGTLLHRNRLLSSLRNQSLSKNVFELLQKLFPIIGSFREYNIQKFKYDFMAGLTLAILAIPQVIDIFSHVI